MTDGYELTLSGLLRKREELAKEAATARGHLDAQLVALDAIDAAIRVFDPTIGPEDLPQGKPLTQHPAGRSEIRRFLIDFLRSTGRPVKTLEAHKALMEARGIDTRDKAPPVLLRKRTTDAQIGRASCRGRVCQHL